VIIAAEYSFKNGRKTITARWPALLDEIEEVVSGVHSERHKTKASHEKTMPGQLLFSPVALNKTIGAAFEAKGWRKQKVHCDYPTNFYRQGYHPQKLRPGAFREMDFLKERLGVEVQFGKYAFMVYNVCAKMTIFRTLGFIDAGVEIVPVKSFADEMSSGVSYFEQFVWDLEKRGQADIDIPVLIYGVDR
jgi:hypothetical protein